MSALPFPATRRHAGTDPRPDRRQAGPEPRPDRRLRVVDPPRHTGRYALAVVAVTAAGVFGIVSLSALAAESAFAALQLERDIAELGARYDELTAEVAELESPARVRRVATEELGMVPAEQPAFLLATRPLEHERPAPAAGGGGGGGGGEGLLADPVKTVPASGG